MYQLLEVNKPFPGYPDTELPEGAFLDLKNGQLTLEFFMLNIQNYELESFKKGKKEFALTFIDNIIFVLYKFGNLQLMDVPFSINLVPAERRILPDIPTENSRATIVMHLVERKNRILKMIKLVTVSPEFTRCFYDCVHTQLQNPFIDNFKEKLNRIYSTKSPQDLLKESIVRCSGGD